MAHSRRRGARSQKIVAGDQQDPFGFPQMVSEFCEWMGMRGLSERTIEDRRKRLGWLAAWLAERGITRPAEVTKPILDAYRRHLFYHRTPAGKPLSFGTQRAYIVSVKAFFSWAARDNRILYNPASELTPPRAEKRLPKAVLTVSEVERVLATPNTRDPIGLRDRAMLEVLYSTGIRRFELAGLCLQDLDAERGTLLVRQGKGRKDRFVPIGERALSWVERYTNEVRPRLAAEPDDGVFFLTRDGEAFTGGRLTSLARSYVAASGVSKTGACHLFRHTMATLMLEGGADIRHIQAILGHASLETTEVYTRLSIRTLQAVHQATHPGATNARHRSPNHPALLGPVRGEHGDVVSLFSALDRESEHESSDADDGQEQALL